MLLLKYIQSCKIFLKELIVSLPYTIVTIVINRRIIIGMFKYSGNCTYLKNTQICNIFNISVFQDENLSVYVLPPQVYLKLQNLLKGINCIISISYTIVIIEESTKESSLECLNILKVVLHFNISVFQDKNLYLPMLLHFKYIQSYKNLLKGINHYHIQ